MRLGATIDDPGSGERDRLVLNVVDRGLELGLLQLASAQKGPHRFDATGADAVEDIVEKYRRI